MSDCTVADQGASQPAGEKSAGAATRGTLLLSIGQAARVISGAVLYIVAGRLLPADEFGRFAVVFVGLSWAGVVLESVILPGLQKVVSEDERRLRPAIGFALRWYVPAALAFGVAGCAAAPTMAALLGDRRLTPLLLLAAAQLPLLGVVKLVADLLVGVQRYAASSAVRVIYNVLRTLAGCLLLALGAGAAGAVAGLGGGTLLAAAASAALLLMTAGRLPSVACPEMGRRAAYWTSVWLPAEAAYAVLMTLDVWLVKALMHDPAAAGDYAAAYSLSRMPMFLAFGLGGAVFPRASAEIARGDAEAARAVAAQAMRFLLIVFAPCCAFFTASAPQAVGFLYSARYASAGPSVAILGPALFGVAQMNLACMLLAAADRPARRLQLTLAVLAVAAACNFAFIPALGIEGAALACLVAYGVGAALGMFLVYRVLHATLPLRSVVRCGLAGALVYAAARSWPGGGWTVLVEVGALGMLYLAALFVLRELRMGDAMWFLSVLRRRPHRSLAPEGQRP
jgi:O-antigen/teichoic acid export membrane protein